MEYNGEFMQTQATYLAKNLEFSIFCNYFGDENLENTQDYNHIFQPYAIWDFEIN